MLNRQRFKESDTTGVNSGEGTAYSIEAPAFRSSQVFCVICIAQLLVFCVVFCGPLRVI